MSFRSEVIDAAREAGGSFETCKARQQMVGQLADFLQKQNIQIRHVADLKPKHVIGWISAAKTAGVADRTLQNRLTAIKSVLRAVGLDRRAASMSTADLGISGASREGSRRAISEAELAERAANIKDAGIKSVLDLMRSCGLRQLEGIRAERDTLERWQRELGGSGRITVLAGTKGGRPRSTLVPDRERAREAVNRALAVAKARAGRLIDRPDLKKALNAFNNATRAAGFTGELSPHSLRYAFACESIDRYREAGLSQREALQATSLDLGHGDGRGRWVDHVYSRR